MANIISTSITKLNNLLKRKKQNQPDQYVDSDIYAILGTIAKLAIEKNNEGFKVVEVNQEFPEYVQMFANTCKVNLVLKQKNKKTPKTKLKRPSMEKKQISDA